MGSTSLAVPVGVLADGSRGSLGRGGGAEDGRQHGVLDGLLPGPGFGLAFGKVPVRAGLNAGLFARERWAVFRVAVHAPTGDPCPQFLRRFCKGRFAGSVRCCWLSHGGLFLQEALGTMSGLMQSSSLAENMW